MKRYLIFACCIYYPSGGSGDVKGQADTIEEVCLATKKLNFYDDVEVLDMQDRRWVPESEWAGAK